MFHSSPAGRTEYFEGVDSYLPAAGVEYYYYDQLAYSDQPQVPDLWDLARFVDEVESDHLASGPENFSVLGH